MKHIGLLAAAAVVVVVLVLFVGFTTGILGGLIGGGYKPPTFGATVTAKVDNRTVLLNVTVTGGTAPYSFIYDFGDGTSRVTTQKGVSYTYTAAGSYTVSVIVRDSTDALVRAAVSVTVV